MSHTVQGVTGEESYMKSFYNTLSKHFLERIGLIKKQNCDWLLGHVCAATALNPTISGGEWDHDNMVSEPDIWSEVCQCHINIISLIFKLDSQLKS